MGWRQVPRTGDQAGQPVCLARQRAAMQDRGHGRTQQPAGEGDARCQRELLHRFHRRPCYAASVGITGGAGDIPSALAGTLRKGLPARRD